MKKSLYLCLLLAIVSIMATGCAGCQSENKEQPEVDNKMSFSSDYDGVLPDMKKGAEHIVSLHRQTMYKLVEGNTYYWYETKFTLTGEVTSESLLETEVSEITSTFQTFEPELCYTITTNASKGTLIPAPTPGIWIEDFDLSKESIKLTVKDVLQKLSDWNGVLPKGTTYIILRKPVGPLDCNAQYVIGNPFEAVWVDAVTGKVSDSCPAFPSSLAKKQFSNK